MAGAVMRITDFLGASRTNAAPSIMGFPNIDIEGTAKRLKIKERAAERGGRNLPAPDEEALDVVEQQIVNELETEGTTQYQSYLDSQKTYADRISAAGVESLIVEIGSLTSSAITEFESCTRVGTGDLVALRRDMVDSDRELKAFRNTHCLLRPATHQGGKSYNTGVLIFILAVETVLNGSFFAQGDVLGPLGGALQAFIIAALNVFIGFMVGRLVMPWTSPRSTTIRIPAVLGVMLYLAAAIVFNLGVAHYRTAYAIDADTASKVAYAAARSDLFGITDIQSWALFLMGLFFSLVAAVDGFLWDDPYPGYGSRTRQNRQTLESYNSKKAELLDQLTDIKDDAEERLEDIARNIQNRRAEYGQIAVKSDALRSAIIDHFRQIESACNTLLREYRDENRTHRTDGSVPKHFDTHWTYNSPAVEGRVYTDPKALDEVIHRALADIPQKLESLHAAYRLATNEYVRVDELIEVGDGK
jgi:hypothetical protein